MPTEPSLFSESQEVARFAIDGEPVTKGRARMYVRDGNPSVYTPARTRLAELAVVEAMVEQAPEAIIEDDRYEYSVEMTFVSATRQRRDVDNMAKLVMDALNHRLWADDAQVVRIVAQKVHGDPPRTEVVVHRVGVMDRPTTNCVKCGTAFRMYSSWSVQNRRYCSRECSADARRKLVTRHCWRCGIPVTMGPGESRRVQRAYCTEAHRLYTGGRPIVAVTDPLLAPKREHASEQRQQIRIRHAVGDPVRKITRSAPGNSICEGATLLIRTEGPMTTREIAVRLSMSAESVARQLARDPSLTRQGSRWDFTPG